MTLKRIALVIAICISYGVKGQYVPPTTEETTPPNSGGIYLRGAFAKGLGVSFENLYFSNNSGSYANITLAPGSGLDLQFGTGLRTKLFDFEIWLEESILFAYTSTSNGYQTSTFSCSMLKTQLFGSGFFKIPIKKNGNFIRIGGGPFLTFPSKFSAKLDGSRLGHSKYSASVGGNVDFNFAVEVKSVYLTPGMRIKVASLDSTEITFEENQESLSSVNISSIDFYFGIQF